MSLSFLAPSQPCGGLLTEPTGLMKSPDLDQDGYYDNWVECFWTIRLDWRKIIELTIVSLKLEFDFDGCLTDYLEVSTYLSRLMGKPTICIGENKGADQLRSNCEADQRLCFRFTDSTIPLLPKYEIPCF